MYTSTKTYGHEIGLSSCFRQHRAKSHCRFLHGYALSVRLEFEADELDENNWVIDFGGLKSFKTWLESKFDHKLIIAEDDPQRAILASLTRYELVEVIVLPATGCEAFAEFIFHNAHAWLVNNGHTPRVKIAMVEVREHGANGAIYRP